MTPHITGSESYDTTWHSAMCNLSCTTRNIIKYYNRSLFYNQVLWVSQNHKKKTNTMFFFKFCSSFTCYNYIRHKNSARFKTTRRLNYNTICRVKTHLQKRTDYLDGNTPEQMENYIKEKSN